MIHLVIIRSDLKITEAFTTLKKAYMILYASLPRFQLIFMLFLVADAFEELEFSCGIISAVKS